MSILPVIIVKDVTNRRCCCFYLNAVNECPCVDLEKRILPMLAIWWLPCIDLLRLAVIFGSQHYAAQDDKTRWRRIAPICLSYVVRLHITESYLGSIWGTGKLHSTPLEFLNTRVIHFTVRLLSSQRWIFPLRNTEHVNRIAAILTSAVGQLDLLHIHVEHSPVNALIFRHTTYSYFWIDFIRANACIGYMCNLDISIGLPECRK